MAVPHVSSLPESVRHYILRKGNVMVPLVPADQLPYQVQGVPRQLSHRQMAAEGWKFVDETTEPVSVLHIDAAKQSASSQNVQPRPFQARTDSSLLLDPKFLAPDHYVRNDASGVPAEPSTSTKYRQAPYVSPPSLPAAIDTTREPRGSIGPADANHHISQSLTDSFASVYQKDAQRLGYTRLPPSGIGPDPSKKEYCTHWIQTGECAYVAVGCKYKHEMPTTDKLCELGFRNGVPRWYKEKLAIQSRGQTWMEQRVNMSKEEREQGQDSEPPARREFPDPSTFRRYKQDDKNADRGMLKRVEQNGSSLKGVTEPGRSTLNKEHGLGSAVSPEARPVSPLPDLLIDIDTPAPPPSPQLSRFSTTSAESSVWDAPGSSSSVSFVSPPASPRLASLPAPSRPEEVHKKMLQPSVRRSSQVSMSSDEDVIQAAKELSKRTLSCKKGSKQAVKPATAKHTGMAQSKFAPADKDTTEAPAKPTKSKAKNAETQGLQAQMTKSARQQHQRGLNRGTPGRATRATNKAGAISCESVAEKKIPTLL